MSSGDSGLGIEAIFRKYKDFVHRICLRYLRNVGDAEDLSQEVFIKIHMRLPEFRGDAALTTWIYRIAVNSCLDALRARKSPLRSAVDLDEMVVANLSESGDAELARIDLGRILEQTDSRTREILFLTLAEGCSYLEAGEVVGMTKWAVAKIVVRFQKKIQGGKKAWLAELFQGHGGVKDRPDAGTAQREVA